MIHDAIYQNPNTQVSYIWAGSPDGRACHRCGGWALCARCAATAPRPAQWRAAPAELADRGQEHRGQRGNWYIDYAGEDDGTGRGVGGTHLPYRGAKGNASIAAGGGDWQPLKIPNSVAVAEPIAR